MELISAQRGASAGFAVLFSKLQLSFPSPHPVGRAEQAEPSPPALGEPWCRCGRLRGLRRVGDPPAAAALPVFQWGGLGGAAPALWYLRRGQPQARGGTGRQRRPRSHRARPPVPCPVLPCRALPAAGGERAGPGPTCGGGGAGSTARRWGEPGTAGRGEERCNMASSSSTSSSSCSFPSGPAARGGSDQVSAQRWGGRGEAGAQDRRLSLPFLLYPPSFSSLSSALRGERRVRREGSGLCPCPGAGLEPGVSFPAAP